jgi:plasmid stabilization system protein ParE
VKAPRITLTDLAVADILEQADWYEAQADRKLAKRWEQAVTSTLLRISQKPDAGSLCTFKADELHGTRRVPVARFSKHLKRAVRGLMSAHGRSTPGRQRAEPAPSSLQPRIKLY